MRESLERIDRLNPSLNAVVTLTADSALARAALADEAAARGEWLGPLHGLPVFHKDLFDTAGVRTTYGSPLFARHVPSQDAILVARMRAAGAIALGKTNTPEFGAGSQTFNPVFGVTRNPWDPAKTCGGSSGGSAVALATGMAALADGTDTGGSLRNPAAFCGIAGLRPSPGRVPLPSPLPWSPLTVAGPMARTVADLALALQAIAGPHPAVPLSLPEDASLFARPLERDFRGVRIAWCASLPGVPFEREIVSAFEGCRRIFEALGCEIVEDAPDFEGADEAFRTLRAFEFYANHHALLHRLHEMKETVADEIQRGSRLTSRELAGAEQQRAEIARRMGGFLMDREFLILPATQVAPFDVERQWVEEIDGERLATYIDWMKSCYYISMTGLPALSAPAGFTASGLPVGLQIVGRPRADFSVLELAHAFTGAR